MSDHSLTIVVAVIVVVAAVIVCIWKKMRQKGEDNSSLFFPSHSIRYLQDDTAHDKVLVEQVSLILVFGKSKKQALSDLIGKTDISAATCEILKQYEWFWYGKQNLLPVIHSSENSGNMFWLRIDFSGKNLREIKNYLDISDLLTHIMNQKLDIEPITVGGPFDYAILTSKGFFRA